MALLGSAFAGGASSFKADAGDGAGEEIVDVTGDGGTAGGVEELDEGLSNV